MFVQKISGNTKKLVEFDKNKIRNAIIQAYNQIEMPSVRRDKPF